MSSYRLGLGHCGSGKIIFGILNSCKLLVEFYRIEIKSLKIFLAVEINVNTNYIDTEIAIALGSVFDATRRSAHYLYFSHFYHLIYYPFRKTDLCF